MQRYKPQKIAPSFEGSVRDLLQKKIRDAYLHSQFQADVFKPLMIEELLDQEVKNLSGGELQVKKEEDREGLQVLCAKRERQ